VVTLRVIRGDEAPAPERRPEARPPKRICPLTPALSPPRGRGRRSSPFFRKRASDAWALVAHSLSGRLLLLTILYVLLTEVLILLPDAGPLITAAFWSRTSPSAEIAISCLSPNRAASNCPRVSGRELLARAGAGAVMLKRADQRELFSRP